MCVIIREQCIGLLFVSSIKVEYAAKSPFSSDHGNWLIHSRKRAWAKQHVGWRWIVSYVRWRTGNRDDLYLEHRGYPYGRKTCSECPSLSFRPTESSLDQNSARLGHQAAWTAGIHWPPPWHSNEKNGKELWCSMINIESFGKHPRFWIVFL